MCVLINKSNFVVELKRVPHIMAARLGGACLRMAKGMYSFCSIYVYAWNWTCLHMAKNVSLHVLASTMSAMSPCILMAKYMSLHDERHVSA